MRVDLFVYTHLVVYKVFRYTCFGLCAEIPEHTVVHRVA